MSISSVRQRESDLTMGASTSPGLPVATWSERVVLACRAALSHPRDLAVQADPGVETLKRMASVDKYNQWIYRRLQPYVGSRILEVGCGLGNMTPFFLGRDRLVSIDVLSASVSQVRELYGDRPRFLALQGDILDQDLVESLRDQQFDTVVCLNVLEHIGDDSLALRHMASLLRPNGRLVLFVPAGQYLYGHLDTALLHFRRYDRGTLSFLAHAAGLKIGLMQYMNPAGIPGWFLASRVLRRSAPPRGLLHLFNFLAPLFMGLEDRITVPVGLSLLCVLECDSAR